MINDLYKRRPCRVAAYQLALVFCFLFAFSAVANAEEIQHFDTAIDIKQDGSFTVTEKITYDFGDTDRHGIFRYILTDHPQDASAWFRERFIDIEIQDVLRGSSTEPYSISQERGQIYVKIGDSSVTHSGVQHYTLTYLVRGGLSYFQDRSQAEIYWNVTGDGWEVPMRKVTATLSAPQGMLLEERACYRDFERGPGTCDISQRATSTLFTTTRLAPGQEMTFAQALKGSEVEELVLERTEWWIFLGVASLIWFVGLIWFVYQYRTKYRSNKPIIAQYEPYEDFKPMYSGLLFDGRLDPKDITACIVYLAEQGYLKIQKIDKKVMFFFSVDDYKLTLVKSAESIESTFQSEVLSLLFDDIHASGATVTLSELKSDLSKQKKNQKTFKELKKDLEKELKRDGFFEVNIPKRFIFGVVVAFIIGGIYLGSFAFSKLPEYLLSDLVQLVPFLAVFLFGSVVVLAFMYRRRTTKGYEALNHLEGFKQFLSVTEKERYAFHNAPKKSPEQFMEYLPYAIAFGVEKEWADVFKDITIPDPTWYDTGGSAAHFSATNLAVSMGAFSSAFVSSSGSSASSGGGSAGGGAGGGGGGSW